MLGIKKVTLNVVLAISSTIIVMPVKAEPWAPVSADSEQWSEQQKSRKNLKRIRGLFERLKSPGDSAKVDRETTVVTEDRNPWMESVRKDSGDVGIPSYLENSRLSDEAQDFFVFGQDDPTSLLPSVQVYESSQTPPRASVPDVDQSLKLLSDVEDVIQESKPTLNNIEEISQLSDSADVMEYVVRPGDSLRQIARKVYQEPKKFVDIMQWNNLVSHNIYPGQKLILESVTPVQKDEFTRAIEQEQRNLFPEQLYLYKVHKVRNGDSLARISKIYLGSQRHYAQLARLNELDSTKYLRIGQKLIVPVRKPN